METIRVSSPKTEPQPFRWFSHWHPSLSGDKCWGQKCSFINSLLKDTVIRYHVLFGVKWWITKKKDDHPLHSSMTVAPATPQFSTPSTPNLGLPTKTRWRFARVSVSGCARAAVVKFQPSKVFSCSWPKSPRPISMGKVMGGWFIWTQNMPDFG